MDVVTTDQGTIKRIETSANDITTKLRARVKDIATNRKSVPIVSYVQSDARQAVWDYAGTAALSGWLVGIGIDLMPALFAMLLMLTAREPLMLRTIEPSAGEHIDYDNWRRPPSE